MLLYLARISAKKEYELLDLFHRSNMQEVEFFAVVFSRIFFGICRYILYEIHLFV